MSILSLQGHSNESSSPFDAIRRVDSNGVEYWSARDLMPLLGYIKWQKFDDAIQRAMLACSNAGESIPSHFTHIEIFLKRPQGGGRSQEDYELSRYACYLTAMSGDSRKTEIAQAQTYFALKLTFLDELVTHFTGYSPDIFPSSSSFERDLSGFVYLVEAVGMQRYKIGYSKEVYKRVSSIQTSTPFEISVLYRYFSTDAPQLEKLLHEYYDAYRIRGEWFELPLSEVANFLNVANKLDQGIELNTGLEEWANKNGDRQMLLGE